MAAKPPADETVAHEGAEPASCPYAIDLTVEESRALEWLYSTLMDRGGKRERCAGGAIVKLYAHNKFLHGHVHDQDTKFHSIIEGLATGQFFLGEKGHA